MNEITEESRDKFLEELTELSRKHGILIAGCGCCGSPYLAEIEPDEVGGFYKTHYNLEELSWAKSEPQP